MPRAASVVGVSTDAITNVAPGPVVAELRSLAEARGLAAGSNSHHPWRAPRWQLAVAGVVGCAAVIAIGITIHGLVQRGDEIAVAPVPAPGRTGSDAPPPAADPVVQSPAGPAETPPLGATGFLPALPDAGVLDAAAAPPAPLPAPRTVEPASGAAGPPTPLSNLAADHQQNCPATLDRDRAAGLHDKLPQLIIECWCQPVDAAHARIAFAWLAPRDRDHVHRSCARLGVDL
jgi:hypothetical protein